MMLVGEVWCWWRVSVWAQRESEAAEAKREDSSVVRVGGVWGWVPVMVTVMGVLGGSEARNIFVSSIWVPLSGEVVVLGWEDVVVVVARQKCSSSR